MAFRLTYLISQNETWLRTVAWPVVRDSANFFASRAERDPVSGNYTQKQVVTPDEGAGIVDDAVYTNAAAARTLQFASLAARKLNMTANPQWEEIKQHLGPGEHPHDRPDLIARVFHLKWKQLLHEVPVDHVPVGSGPEIHCGRPSPEKDKSGTSQ